MIIKVRDTFLFAMGIVVALLGIAAAYEGSWPGFIAGCGTGLLIAIVLALGGSSGC